MTPADLVVLLADLQEGIVQGSRTNPEAELRKSAKALTDLACALGMPAVINMVQLGPDAPKAIAEIGDASGAIVRHGPQAFAFPPLKEAVLATGRPTLILAGVVSEIVVLHAALGAIEAGLQVQVAVDACGGMSDRTERAAFGQIERAGGVLTSVASLATSLASDFTTEDGKAVMGVVMPLLRG